MLQCNSEVWTEAEQFYKEPAAELLFFLLDFTDKEL